MFKLQEKQWYSCIKTNLGAADKFCSLFTDKADREVNKQTFLPDTIPQPECRAKFEKKKKKEKKKRYPILEAVH